MHETPTKPLSRQDIRAHHSWAARSCPSLESERRTADLAVRFSANKFVTAVLLRI